MTDKPTDGPYTYVPVGSLQGAQGWEVCGDLRIRAVDVGLGEVRDAEKASIELLCKAAQCGVTNDMKGAGIGPMGTLVEETLLALLNQINELRAATDNPSYPPCDYCGDQLDYHPWHGSGVVGGVVKRHIHACDECRRHLPSNAKNMCEPTPASLLLHTLLNRRVPYLKGQRFGLVCDPAMSPAELMQKLCEMASAGATPMDQDWCLVPRVPTEVQAGLAQAILRWLPNTFARMRTPENLVKYLTEYIGIEIPAWMENDPVMANSILGLSDMARLVYRAMIEAERPVVPPVQY